MRIDSHQHFWKTSRGDYHWMSPEVPILHRDYYPEDLRPLLDQHKIDKTILVQAAPTISETDFLLAMGERTDFVAGVVGWMDMEKDDFADQLSLYCAKPKFTGLRPMLQDIPDDDYILRPRAVESLKIVAERGLPFDFLTYVRQLPSVIKVLEQVPDLRAVVDHISKPEIKVKRMEPWRSLIREVAQHRNVYCKLSGMITEADHRSWTADQLRPYVEHVIECFGLERVMFGSDWPVCLQAGSYTQVIEALYGILKPVLNGTSEAAVFGLNAARFYGIG
jgi:L-fuconolactonase